MEVPIEPVMRSELNSNIWERDYSENCTICLEEITFQNKYKTLPCFHNFHANCIDSWLNQAPSCPICKTQIN